MHYNRARFNFLWGGTVASLGVAGFFSLPALAQVVPDNTLGTEGSRVAPNVLIRGTLGDRIDGGALRGSNLFHSFSQFNVNDGQRVYFSNPARVENILSRVTGGDVSDIMGTLGVDGGANLYFLNPNGIIFGPNAQLDIAGSFVASTGSAFIFPNGEVFSAVDPQAPPLLTINVPVGIQYGAGDIANQGNLTVGQDLTLSAANLTLEGQLRAGGDLTLQAQNTLRVRDTPLVPFVAEAGGNLTLQGNGGIDIVALQHPAQTPFVSGGALSLLSDGLISTDAHFDSGGNFQIRSLSGQLAQMTSLYDPIISSANNVDIAGSYSGASLLIESQGNVRIQGGVTITQPDLVSAFVGADAILRQVPGLIIRSGQPSLVYGGSNQNNPPAYTNGDIPAGITLGGAMRVVPNAQGGVVNLTAVSGDITVASIDASNRTGGTGGAITLTAVNGDITTTGSFLGPDDFDIALGSFSYSESGDAGNGGAIAIEAGGNINTGDLDSSSVSFSERGDAGNAGNAGAITLEAGGNINTQSLDSSSFSDGGNAGSGGGITLEAGGDITTEDLSSQSRSDLFSGNAGNGGAITLEAGGDITTEYLISQSRSEQEPDSFSDLFPGNAGNAGNGGAIALEAGGNINTFFLLSTSLSGVIAGNGGAITLEAGGNINTFSLISYSYSDGIGNGNAGNGGAIALSAGSNITVIDRVDSSSFGSSSLEGNGNAGNGGAIALEASSNINTGRLSSASLSFSANAGNGGAIALEAGGNINTADLDSYSSSSGGNAGNAGAIALLTANGNIRIGPLGSFSSSSSGDAGNGGAIRILAPRGNIEVTEFPDVFGIVADEADISSFAIAEGTRQAGQGGNVTITARNLIANLAIVTLSSSSNSGSVRLSGFRDLTLDNVSVVTSRQLEIPNPSGGEPISINTEGQGQSGDVRIGSSGTLTIRNSLIQSDTNGSESAGNVTLISPNRITFDNSDIISSSNSRGSAGNITIRTNQLLLDNSELTADTRSGGEGNIRLRGLDLLVMRNNSLISTAARAEAGGGNIRINTPKTRGGFVIGSGNSDIIATAEAGAGGQIGIYAEGIVGFVEQSESDRELLRNYSTNDISASSASGSQGTVDITTSVDPIQGIIELPTDLVDASQQIAAGCGLGNDSDENEFIVTGRGGLPPSSSDPLTASAVDVPWVVADDVAPNNVAPDNAVGLSATAMDAPLVEAQGMWVDADGNIHLVAEVETELTANPTAIASQFCAVSSH